MSTREAGPDGPDEMGRELAEGPAAVEGTLTKVGEALASYDALVERADRIVLIGTGASLAIARTAAPAWRRRVSKPVIVRQSTEAVLSDADGHRFQPGDLVVAISQSGTSPETLAALRRARSADATAVALSSHPDSPLGAAASLVVEVPSGQEAGASTKSALATLAALYAMAGELPSDADSAHSLRQALAAVVAEWTDAVAVGAPLAQARRTWLVGFGTSLGLAEAGALLWHEKVVRPAVALTPSEFRHGPIEAAGPDDVVLVVDVDRSDPLRAAYLARLAEELAALGVARVDVGVEPRDSALAALVRLQQLARATALSAGTYRDGFAILRSVIAGANDLFD